MLSTQDLRQQVIRPTLAYLGIDATAGGAQAAENLLIATAALESDLNPLCHHDDGLGIYQITPDQHRRLWDEYLAFDPDLASRVRGLASQHQFLQDPHQELIHNLCYATAIAWLIYRREGGDIGAEADSGLLSQLWSRCFHPEGASAERNKRFRGWLSKHGAPAAA